MVEFIPRLVRMSKQEIAEDVRHVIDMLEKEEESRRSRYPFEEGDDYWTIEDGRVVWSCWDWVSEQMHDENPNQNKFGYVEEKYYLRLINQELFSNRGWCLQGHHPHKHQTLCV